MNRTFKGYENYGCLAAEKRTIYTALIPHPTATSSEPVEYTAPDGWEIRESAPGDVIVTAPWGWEYSPNELLEGNKYPYFAGINKDGDGFRIQLECRKL